MHKLVIFKFISLMVISMVMIGCASNERVIELGESSSKKTWVYLCGLTPHINSLQETENRQILDDLGKKLSIKILAVHPFDRCKRAEEKLCWLHYTPEQTMDTYHKILNEIGNINVSGFIGFSNGGFFLNKLAQIQSLEAPIISVGAGGSLSHPRAKNTLSLVIGRLEPTYDSALKFFKAAKGSPLSITLIEHEGGHILPRVSLYQLLDKGP